MTRTKEQEVVEARKAITKLREKYSKALNNYVLIGTKQPEKQLELLLDCQKWGNEYFNFAEEFVGNSDLLGAHKCSLWIQGFAEDCAEILNTMPQHYKLLTEGFKNTNLVDLEKTRPGLTAYANMQRLVVKYLDSSLTESIKKKFIDFNLPIYGFENEARHFGGQEMKTMLAYFFGFFFVLVLIVIAIFFPNPSFFQNTVFRTVLAIAAAACAAIIPGFIEVNLNNYVKAGGAIAVFVIVYFFLPAYFDDSSNTKDNAKKLLTTLSSSTEQQSDVNEVEKKIILPQNVPAGKKLENLNIEAIDRKFKELGY